MMSRDPASVAEVQLVSPEVLRCPFPFYARARAEAPVHRMPMGAWIVTRYDDVVAVLKDTKRFTNFVPGATDPEILAIHAEGYPETPTLLAADPPMHGAFRSLVNKAFVPSRVVQLEGTIATIADELIDALWDAVMSTWWPSSPWVCR
jgi:cytochrome P450